MPRKSAPFDDMRRSMINHVSGYPDHYLIGSGCIYADAPEPKYSADGSDCGSMCTGLDTIL